MSAKTEGFTTRGGKIKPHTNLSREGALKKSETMRGRRINSALQDSNEKAHGFVLKMKQLSLDLPEATRDEVESFLWKAAHMPTTSAPQIMAIDRLCRMKGWFAQDSEKTPTETDTMGNLLARLAARGITPEMLHREMNKKPLN